MTRPTPDGTISFELDTEQVTARPGETIWSAARRHGVACTIVVPRSLLKAF